MKEYKYRKTFTYEGKRYVVRADTLEELYEKRAQKLHDLHANRLTLTGDMMLRDWAVQCIETYKTNQKPETRKKFMQRVEKCILEDIGQRSLKSIRPLEVQACMNRQAGMSRTQVTEVYDALRFLFSHAYSNHLIPSDPTEDLTKPAFRKQEHHRSLTAEERRVFIEVGKTDRRFYFFLLMLFCGCRPSEAEEAQGRDITAKDGIPLLHIRGTKTTLADRTVPIPDELYELIRKTPPFEYIACTSGGHRIDPATKRRVWKNYTRRINIAMGCQVYRHALVPPYPLAPDLAPYNLRVEYCTNLARLGVDIRIAQKMMGHSTIALTANVYTQFQNDDLNTIAGAIGAGCHSGCHTITDKNGTF